MTEEVLIEKKVANQSETKTFVAEIVTNFSSGDTVLFYGDLGSGKTYMISLLVKLLGNSTEVTSPSFSIINQYNGDVIINHIDFYRIKNEQELFNLGLDDIFNMDSVNFIEWPQIIEEKVYWNHFRIYIEFDKNKNTGRYFKLVKMTE